MRPFLENPPKDFYKHPERGATAIEYALVAALIAIAAITIMGTAGDKVTSLFHQMFG